MPLPISDYALLSDSQTGTLVGNDGSIDWLCLPRYDSASIFSALLGSEDHGRWLLAPTHAKATSRRHYMGDSMVLSTIWTTPDGEIEVIETMPIADKRADIVRQVRGLSGSVEVRQEIRFRFDYARVVPWVRRQHGKHGEALSAVAGPDAVVLRGPHLPRAKDHMHESTFTVEAGQILDFSLTWYASHLPTPPPVDISDRIEHTRMHWEDWAANCQVDGPYRGYVMRSLLTLRALTHSETGGIVAAATTSLPESMGGERNWDYRYCWLRDASLTLQALLTYGKLEGADHWRRWLLRAIAGDPEDLQIMYGLSGERRLTETELDNLPGYLDSAPVRVGNGAVGQYQADVLGEVLVALDIAREAGLKDDQSTWPLQRTLLTFLEQRWTEPDNGIWEVRGPKQHFTHSRAMVWAAFDRGVKAAENHQLEAPVDRWRKIRDDVRAEIENNGFNKEMNSFTQYYGSTTVDAALLVLPQVGFVDYDDERMLGTVERIESELLHRGFLLRYNTTHGVDGLSGDENPFLACSFWLVAQYAHTGRMDDARELMDRLVGLTNDVGLLSEEYDPDRDLLMGNFPQAFSHLALVRAATAINTHLDEAGKG
ncbi:glycoside hydrolase family 15 protein [Spelaeicoccus albus]|uniref:GH15 family glucan-1,4-alpha-glucosidase n=1 Tax=Spelaeicoccus albus TaxID=1280376 RepID=A0A7Z0D466_9MICO|nr:glycoside hydrolase family 15 protein [Spelaeicoccus albus]NYI68564.1 GH15 family glucan-1,4-alpha-glucosidase [Spelaeicoccus albus]